MGGRRHRRFGGGAGRCVDIDGERLVPALDRHHRVVDGDRDVGEDGVAFGRRQSGGGERLGADGIPVRDEGIRRPPGLTTVLPLPSLIERNHRDRKQHRRDEPDFSHRSIPFIEAVDEADPGPCLRVAECRTRNIRQMAD